jgi:outer membrane biosynthesis protein TonB
LNRYTHLSTHLGLALSGLGHVLLFGVAFVLLAHPRVWDATSLPVAIDIVPEREVPKVKPEPSQGLPADRQQEAGDAAPKPAPSQPAAPESAAQQSAQQQSAQQPSSPQGEPWTSPAPAGAAAGLAPWSTAQAGQPAAPTPAPSFYSLNIPGVTDLEFDTPADASARLTPEEMGAFHAQLRKCWHPPASVAGAPKLRAMVRIALTPTGTLARDPLLVRASASAQGPRLVEAATRALQECQPFSFLPAERYQDWKLLDLTFGPQGLSGG